MDELAHGIDAFAMSPSYDQQRNSFVQRDPTTHTGKMVREVKDKKIPARMPPSQYDRLSNDGDGRKDTFTGIIDGITGEILHGTRRYSYTGELYEGPFAPGGLRHGEGAIVKNVYVPDHAKAHDEEPEKTPYLVTDGLGVITQGSYNLSFSRANFFGTYFQDEPSYGTLVTDRFTYKGPFRRQLFHGDNGELIHSSGYIYRGEFRNGKFHGKGREVDPNHGKYKGDFRDGMRYGTGTFTEILPGDIKDENQLYEEKIQRQQKIQQTVDDFVWDREVRVIGSSSELDNTDIAESKDISLASDNDGIIVDSRDKKAGTILSTRYIYSGSYECNLRVGDGTERLPKGEIYTGQFMADRRHGHGSLQNTLTGIKYEGQWRAGIPTNGNGWRIMYPSGDTYVGHADAFIPNGYGICKYADCEVYSGNWKDGQRHGKGARTLRSGDAFVGEWRYDEGMKIKRPEEIDGTLRDIAETLQMTCVADEKDSNNEETVLLSKYEKQRNLLKQRMAASIANSLKMIGSEIENDHDQTVLQHNLSTGIHDNIVAKPGKKMELHTYRNGDTFLGTLDPVTNQRNGYGVYVSVGNNCTYTGEFQSNKRHGYGILTRPGHGKYAGEFSDDQKDGLGTLILEDTSCYHGGFVRGAFQGSGTLCQRDGTVYVGDWIGGLRDGDGGMETFSDGKVYQGEFRFGKRDGEGTLLENIGGKIVYTGEWCDGKYHGQGISVERRSLGWGLGDVDLKSGTVRFEGEFSSGKRHGYGTLESDGITLKGMWSQSEPLSGKWRIAYQDGSIYSGHALIQNKRQTGDDGAMTTFTAVATDFGNMKYANGDVYVGMFLKGVRSGVGTCLFINGDQLEGVWKNDEVDQERKVTLTSRDDTMQVLDSDIDACQFIASI